MVLRGHIYWDLLYLSLVFTLLWMSHCRRFENHQLWLEGQIFLLRPDFARRLVFAYLHLIIATQRGLTSCYSLNVSLNVFISVCRDIRMLSKEYRKWWRSSNCSNTHYSSTTLIAVEKLLKKKLHDNRDLQMRRPSSLMLTLTFGLFRCLLIVKTVIRSAVMRFIVVLKSKLH